jgi:hypothetical protein
VGTVLEEESLGLEKFLQFDHFFEVLVVFLLDGEVNVGFPIFRAFFVVVFVYDFNGEGVRGHRNIDVILLIFYGKTDD